MESNPKKHEIIAKLQIVFDSFLQENFTTVQNRFHTLYFEKLIAHLAEEENAFILQERFALDWVDKAITIIDADITKVSPRVVSFMLNFLGLLISNHWILIQIKERNFIFRVLSLVKTHREHFSPSMKLSLIRVLQSIARYTLGFGLMRMTEAWRFLIEYCNQDHTIYVVREARKLLFELLYSYAVKANDEQTVLIMLGEIVKPILDNIYVETADKITIVVEDNELQHKLASTLDLLSFIFQQTLECEHKTNFYVLCRDHFNLEVNIWKLNEMTTNQPFMQKILTAIASLNFCRLVDENWFGAGQIAPENFNRFGVAFFNLIKFCVARHDNNNILNLVETFHILWKKLGNRAPKEILVENESVCFENQLIVLQIIPLLCLLKSKEVQDFEVFDTYVMKLFEVSCEHTLRLCYSFRDILCNKDTEYLVPSLAYKSIHGILSMENILEHDQAVLVFQAMTYALQEFILNSLKKFRNDSTDPKNNIAMSTELIAEIPNVLYAALVGLQRLIKRYRITWTESIETICVVNFVLHLLMNTNMTSRLIVQALKLLQLSIEHYLSPNMALLVDTLNGSALIGIAPAVARRFHDPAWEVRDSTLELTTSIANISRLKFPPFQQYLVENKIAPIVCDMAKHDSESYVRASAFKCLSKMVAINVIWETELSKLGLTQHLFWVLINESEGIVRKEALVTLSKIYEYRKIPSQYMEILYSTLAHCVVNDFHWEVKVAALHFWELEIEQQFTNQGMIDGTFPAVTFSKEHKKIVTLTEREINLRIVKILNSLSQRGCLGVILKCLHEDCDLEVVKTAIEIVRRLLQKLQKYDYESTLACTDPSYTSSLSISPTCSMTLPLTNHFDVGQNLPEVKMEFDDNNSTVIDADGDADADADVNADIIIEGILDDQDINYLIAACEQQMQLNSSIEKQNVNSNFYKEFALVTAKDFISTIKSIDMEQLLQKQEWFLCAENLNSLLDDILIEIEPNADKIFADCY